MRAARTSASLPLADHGLRWAWPEVDLVHALDGGSAAVLRRDLDATAAGLGADGDAWRGIFGPGARHFEDLAAEVLRPLVHVPSPPADARALRVMAPCCPRPCWRGACGRRRRGACGRAWRRT